MSTSVLARLDFFKIIENRQYFQSNDREFPHQYDVRNVLKNKSMFDSLCGNWSPGLGACPHSCALSQCNLRHTLKNLKRQLIDVKTVLSYPISSSEEISCSLCTNNDNEHNSLTCPTLDMVYNFWRIILLYQKCRMRYLECPHLLFHNIRSNYPHRKHRCKPSDAFPKLCYRNHWHACSYDFSGCSSFHLCNVDACDEKSSCIHILLVDIENLLESIESLKNAWSILSIKINKEVSNSSTTAAVWNNLGEKKNNNLTSKNNVDMSDKSEKELLRQFPITVETQSNTKAVDEKAKESMKQLSESNCTYDAIDDEEIYKTMGCQTGYSIGEYSLSASSSNGKCNDIYQRSKKNTKYKENERFELNIHINAETMTKSCSKESSFDDENINSQTYGPLLQYYSPLSIVSELNYEQINDKHEANVKNTDSLPTDYFNLRTQIEHQDKPNSSSANLICKAYSDSYLLPSCLENFQLRKSMCADFKKIQMINSNLLEAKHPTKSNPLKKKLRELNARYRFPEKGTMHNSDSLLTLCGANQLLISHIKKDNSKHSLPSAKMYNLDTQLDGHVNSLNDISVQKYFSFNVFDDSAESEIGCKANSDYVVIVGKFVENHEKTLMEQLYSNLMDNIAELKMPRQLQIKHGQDQVIKKHVDEPLIFAMHSPTKEHKHVQFLPTTNFSRSYQSATPSCHLLLSSEFHEHNATQVLPFCSFTNSKLLRKYSGNFEYDSILNQLGKFIDDLFIAAAV